MCQVEAGGLEVLGPCWLQGSEPQLNLTLSTEEYWGACMPEKLTTRHIWICAPTAPLGATSPSFSSPSAFLCVVLAPRQALDMWLGSFLSILPAQEPQPLAWIFCFWRLILRLSHHRGSQTFSYRDVGSSTVRRKPGNDLRVYWVNQETAAP